jgi:membrane-bound ClpP family serine protease
MVNISHAGIDKLKMCVIIQSRRKSMEFVAIFTEMNWLPAMFLILGVTFLLVETFVPGFGFFGISGIVSLIVGVIIRICQGLNLTQSLGLILIIVGFFALCGLYMVFSAQYGILG